MNNKKYTKNKNIIMKEKVRVMDKPISVAIIGAGARGANVYVKKAPPGSIKVVAVAEPHKGRREEIQKRYSLPDEVCFESYVDLLKKERLADLALITTNDRMHMEPALSAIEKGCHILLEKPISPMAEEVYKIGKASEKYDKVFSICHVLRYTSFFKTIKKLLNDGRVGRLMSITHNEDVGYWHMAHSFVRGNWRNSEETSPMILQKCCHDMDILLYLIDSDCVKVSSFGKLSLFKEENAPKGAPDRCTEGCPEYDTCQFNAVKLYTETDLRGWVPKNFNLDEGASDEVITEALKTNPYGRCVYKCDNNVVDHQVVNMEFENDVTVAFTMCAFTKKNNRIIKLMGTDGEINGDMEAHKITIYDFKTGNTEEIHIPEATSGHGGGDSGIMASVLNAIRGNGTDNSSAQASVQSHMMAFAAERSRLENKVVDLKAFIEEIRTQNQI